jgi:hypothetical protein
MKNILNKFLNLFHINKKITLQQAIDDNLTVITIIYPQPLNDIPTIRQIGHFVYQIDVKFYQIKHLNGYFAVLIDPKEKSQIITLMGYSEKHFKKYTSITTKDYTKNIFITTTKKEAVNFINELLKTYKEYLKIYLNKPQNNNYYNSVKQIKHKIYEITMKIYGLHVQTS